MDALYNQTIHHLDRSFRKLEAMVAPSGEGPGRKWFRLPKKRTIGKLIVEDGLDLMIELTREFLDVKVIAISGVPGKLELLGRAKLLGASFIAIRKPQVAGSIPVAGSIVNA